MHPAQKTTMDTFPYQSMVLMSVMPPSLNLTSPAKLFQIFCVHANLNPIHAMTPRMKTPMNMMREPIMRTLP